MAGMARFLPCLLPGVTGHGAMQLCRKELKSLEIQFLMKSGEVLENAGENM